MNESSKLAMGKSGPSQEPMGLEQARKVMWLRSNCRPLGELLDEGYLNQSRLEWAAEKAYDHSL